MPRRVIQPGQTYGRWTVLESAPKRKQNPYWLCRCGCGLEKEVFSGNLLSGASSQCAKCAMQALHERREKKPPKTRFRVIWERNRGTMVPAWNRSMEAFQLDIPSIPDGEHLIAPNPDRPLGPDNVVISKHRGAKWVRLNGSWTCAPQIAEERNCSRQWANEWLKKRLAENT